MEGSDSESTSMFSASGYWLGSGGIGGGCVGAADVASVIEDSHAGRGAGLPYEI